MSPDNARKTLINSDYPLDKLILVTSQPITISGGSDVSIAHGMPFTPLVWFQWSYTSDFAIAYEDNTGDFPSGNISYYFRLRITIEADATNITFRGNGTIGSTTVYVRVVAFQPSNYNLDLSGTESLGDDFVVNSDYNYMKLVEANRSALITSGSTLTIPHTVGVRPYALMWVESTLGTIYPVQFSWPLQNLNVEITTTDIIARNDSFTGWYLHYRIYIDE